MLFLALALWPKYDLSVRPTFAYELTVDVDGDLPLLGWKPGKVRLEIEFEVISLKPGTDGTFQAKHRLVSFRSSLNGAPLPFRLENVSGFFPETSISYLPNGKVVKTTAKDHDLPAAIPGLDPRRFPEMTYLPIEFPDTEVELWNFQRQMGADQMDFNVERVPANVRSYMFDVVQSGKFLEDSAGRRVEDPKRAAFQFTTSVLGSGSLLMDSTARYVEAVSLTATTTCTGTPNASTKTLVKRSWKTTVVVKLRK